MYLIMKLLSQHATLRLLRKYNIPYTRTLLFKDKPEVEKQQFSYPVVLKLLNEKIVHKSETGAVITDIKNKTQLIHEISRAETKIRRIYGRIELNYMIQKQEYGHEVIIGMKRDPQFGPVILFGLGGIFVEVFKDVSMRIAPLTDKDIKQMFEIKSTKILNGCRGEKPVCLKDLRNILKKISKLSIHEKDIMEIDFNPVIVNEKYATVVDVRMLK